MIEERMKKEEILQLIIKEVERAEKLHPRFPHDKVYQAAILNEEAGEVLQAANSLREHLDEGTPGFSLSKSLEKMENLRENYIKEVIETGAMVFRILMNQ